MPIKVSIVIPTYNRAAILEQTVAGALAQTYPHLEVVVSDNASADDTPALGRQFSADPRVRWHRQEKNIGLAPNWETLLYDLSSGDYVKVLADDDYLTDPEHVSKAVALIEKHGLRAVFSHGRALAVPSGGMTEVNPVLPQLLTPEWWMDHFGERKDGKDVCPALVTGAVFERKAAIEFNAFRNPVFGMDYQLMLELALSGPTGYLDGSHYVLRHHPENDGNNAALEVVLTSLDLYGRVKAFGLKRGLPEERLNALGRRISVLFARNFIVRTWIRRYGLTPKSWWSLYRKLSENDPAVGRAVALDPAPILRELLKPGSFAWRAARRVYKLLGR
jgi:glycosyltransferase involved in cell wall biosynthesis